MPDESIETQLAVISTKLDVLIEQRSDHEGRIRSLEKFQWKLAGAYAALSVGISAGVTKLLS